MILPFKLLGRSSLLTADYELATTTRHVPYYGPIGETPTEVLLEKTFLISGYLTGLTYGMQLVVYIACMRILWNADNRNRFTYFLLVYITLLCGANTIWTGATAFGLQVTFIDNRNYPGGVIKFFENVDFILPWNIVSMTSYVIGVVLADALLLWRCQIIWSASLGSKGNYYIIPPTILFLASLATGIWYDILVAPNHLGKSSAFFYPFLSITLLLNIILTIMIAGRMWYYQRKAQRILGRDFGRPYTSVVTIFVESAAIYIIFALLLLVTNFIRHPTSYIWLGIAPAAQTISSYLIIYRVAEGRAWGRDTLRKIDVESSIVFCRPSPEISGGSNPPL